jgi:hypothetical protein
MATEFEVQCALMAGRVYLSTRNSVNWFPVPDGWAEFFHAPSETYPITEGFEALSFQKESDTNNIVIAYAGTNGPSDLADRNQRGQSHLNF